ncbi:MAG: DCC1-like thiol-disulfide oxidoreductase family protein [Methylococcaceae bacterium]
MYQIIIQKLLQLHAKQVPATAIGLFRILYSLVTLQEILFLLYFNHLIFDPIPYLDVEFPAIPFFLCLWGIVATFLLLGYRYQFAVIANYIFWILFVNFTPMQRDFDGGFDTFMIGIGFFLIFMPANKAFSLDTLRYKLSTPFTHYSQYTKPTVSALAYYLPVLMAFGWLYFDSAIHKMFAQHWRNGLGSWLPSTQPYYVSALDMSVLLNCESLEKIIGYTILVFQFSFMFFFNKKQLRPIYLLVGMSLHLGITISLNIYPFGLGMLSCYVLLVPFSWWRVIGNFFVLKQPTLTVFYDQLCPLCNRTVLIINHFDILKAIDFKNAQQYASNYPALATISPETLLTDLYALDNNNQVYAGVKTYSQILKHSRYLKLFGLLLNAPLISSYAEKKYRTIADNRARVTCTADCVISEKLEDTTLYTKIFEQYASRKPKAFARKLYKVLVALAFLQLNSTLHYGIFYRVNWEIEQSPISVPVSQASNALILMSQLFVGITPHALYVHDHFMGYDHIIALTYTGEDGVEHWFPFVNEQGRLLAPNWGRVHSMWANIAVTTTINNIRLKKFIMKVTAFYGHELGLDLDKTIINIKYKPINAPSEWVYDQLHKNFAGSWTTIGQARWQGKEITFALPDDLNSL